MTPAAAARACARVAAVLGPGETERRDAAGRWRPSSRGAIRLRQAQALALRRLGATWAEVAAAVGLGADGAAAAARKAEVVEAADPGFAAAVASAAPPSVPGSAALRERASIGKRRPALLRRPPSAARAPAGRALVGDLRLDLAALAGRLRSSRWTPDDADDAVQGAVVRMWHGAVALPADASHAARVVVRWALRRLVMPDRRRRELVPYDETDVLEHASTEDALVAAIDASEVQAW